MEWFILLFFFLFGLVIGSYLNVAICLPASVSNEGAASVRNVIIPYPRWI